ncbi:MAG: hypothetical protein ACOC6Q_01820 [Patescibacteria group bacterium]
MTLGYFGTLENPLLGGYPSGGKGLNLLISNIIGAATVVAGILLVGYLIFGGIQYLTAGGDKEATAKASAMITNAIVGLLIVVLATTITAIVGHILGIPILSPPWETLGP